MKKMRYWLTICLASHVMRSLPTRSCLRVGFSSTRPSRWRLKLAQRAKLESTETTGYKLYSHTRRVLHTWLVLLELHLGTMGETFLHAGVAIPGHDSFPILPLWPDP